MIPSAKNKLELENQGVYKIPRVNCNNSYVGQTNRIRKWLQRIIREIFETYLNSYRTTHYKTELDKPITSFEFQIKQNKQETEQTSRKKKDSQEELWPEYGGCDSVETLSF